MDNPSKRPIPSEIEVDCEHQGWTETKIREFWRMQKNLGEPKTSIEFDSLEEDKMFSQMWDEENLEELQPLPRDGSKDDQNDSSMDPQVTPSTPTVSPFSSIVVLNKERRETYGKGVALIEKMPYLGVGGLGPSRK